MKKEINLKVVQTNDKVKILGSLFTIYLINLKLTLKNVGIIISGVFSVVMLLIMTILPFIIASFTPNATSDDWKGYANMTNDIGYIVYGIMIGIFIIFTVIYLFKKQKKLGLQNIELRSGINPFYIYLIRSLLAITVVFIWTLIGILANTFIVLAYPEGVEKGQYIMQLFFFMFYALIFTFITITVFQVSSTVLGTILMFIVFFVSTLVPFITGMVSSFDNTTNQKYGKLSIRSMESKKVYDYVKNDDNFKVLLNDENFWTQTQNNLKNISLVENTDYTCSIYEDEILGFKNFPEYLNSTNIYDTCFKDYYLGNNYEKMFENTAFGGIVTEINTIINSSSAGRDESQFFEGINRFWINIEADLKKLIGSKYESLYYFWESIYSEWIYYLNLEVENFKKYNNEEYSDSEDFGIFSLITNESVKEPIIDQNNGLNRFLLIIYEMLFFDNNLMGSYGTNSSGGSWSSNYDYKVNEFNGSMKSSYNGGLFNIFNHFALMRNYSSSKPFVKEISKKERDANTPMEYLFKDVVSFDTSSGATKRMWGINGGQKYYFNETTEKWAIAPNVEYKKGFNVIASYFVYLIIFTGFWSLGYPVFVRKIKE